MPLIVLQQHDGDKYLNPNLEPDQILPWLKDYKVIPFSTFMITFMIMQLLKCLIIKLWNSFIHCIYICSLPVSDSFFFWNVQEGKLKAYKKSEAIPEVNDEPVKVVVADNIHDFVLNSGKNGIFSSEKWCYFFFRLWLKSQNEDICLFNPVVLLEFYAPWCGHCKKLVPILEEAAVTLKNEEDVVIAKMVVTLLILCIINCTDQIIVSRLSYIWV